MNNLHTMTSLLTYLSVKADQLALFIGRLILRLAVLLLATIAVLAMAHALGTDQHSTSASTPTPADAPSAPTSPECTPTAGDLFNPCATLDPSTVDYLYDDPEAVCLRSGGVVLPTGECTPAALLWVDEVDGSTWRELKRRGWSQVIGTDQQALLVPVSILVLDKNDVVAVRL